MLVSLQLSVISDYCLKSIARHWQSVGLFLEIGGLKPVLSVTDWVFNLEPRFSERNVRKMIRIGDRKGLTIYSVALEKNIAYLSNQFPY